MKTTSRTSGGGSVAEDASRRPTRVPAPDAAVGTPQERLLASLEQGGVPILERRYAPGEAVYTRGDADRGLCFLLEGTLRVYKGYNGYREATVGLLHGDGLFGEPSLRPEGPHRDSAEAVSPCRVARVAKGYVEGHLRHDPNCAPALMLAMAEWARQRDAAIARLLPREVDSRLDSLLQELAERFGEETDRGTALGLRLTHLDLACMVACTRESVSKEMSRLRRAGLIEKRGRSGIVVLNEPGPDVATVG